jgi:hypothetical protein
VIFPLANFAGVHLSLGIAPIIVFPFFFIGMWCLVSYKISRLGWSTWAERYRCERQISGKSYRGRSGRFSLQGSYKSILNVVLSNEGIGLSVKLLWRVGHEPLLLPWTMVTGVEERNYFFFRNLRVTISDQAQKFVFGLPVSARPEIEKHLSRVDGVH